MAVNSGPAYRPICRSLEGVKLERVIVVIFSKRRKKGHAALEFMKYLREVGKETES